MTTHISQLINLPELLKNNLTQPFCLLSSGQVITRALFLQHALSLSKTLPKKTYVLNLCQDRYLFMVGYMAVLLRQQINLLPPNQTAKTIKHLLIHYKDSYCLRDQNSHHGDCGVNLDLGLLTETADDFPLINIQRPVSISFTSGSTGEPKAIAKTFAEFQHSAKLALDALALNNKPLTLVSTVPPQHMYGLETSLFWMLFSDLAIHNSRPFYPEDIRLTLQSVEKPMLISTPTHLKSCVHTQSIWPKIALLLSSTAPLSVEFANQIERCFHAPLLEIYGSTETLSFATRQASRNVLWKPYQGISLYQEQSNFFVKGGHLLHPVALDDQFEITEAGLFRNLGRATDLIKIGGKRASLSELNRILMQIPDIEDGIFFKVNNGRLAALVVSSLSRNDIISALKPEVDAVFLPRAIYQVTKIPRNETGKIIKAELEHLIKDLNCDADA